MLVRFRAFHTAFVSSNDTKIAPMTICDGVTFGDDFDVSGGAWSGEHAATERRPLQVRLGTFLRFFGNHARNRDGASKGMRDRLPCGVWRNRWDGGSSVGFGSDDSELPPGSQLRLPDDDVDVAPERAQQAKQALQRMFTEVAAQEARNVERGQVEQSRGLGLGDAALADDVVDTAHQPGLDEVRIDIVKTEVGEDVDAAAFHGRVGGTRQRIGGAMSGLALGNEQAFAIPIDGVESQCGEGTPP